MYPEHPVKIVDFKTRVTRNQTSKFYKVQWSNHSEREATWETEEFVRTKCLELLQAYRGTHKFFLNLPFCHSLNLRARFLLGGSIVTTATRTVREVTADSPRGVAQIFIWMAWDPLVNPLFFLFPSRAERSSSSRANGASHRRSPSSAHQTLIPCMGTFLGTSSTFPNP